MSTWQASRIIALLEAPTEDGWSLKKEIAENAPTNELIIALQQAPTPLTRAILCELLRHCCDSAAVPPIIECLCDADSYLRAEAAWALGYIGDPQAGPVLLELFVTTEDDRGIREILPFALGIVGYRPATPYLIAALADPDPVVRGHAGLALGELGAKEAEDTVRLTLDREAEREWTKECLERGLRAIATISKAARAGNPAATLSILVTMLENSDPLFRAAAARAIGDLGTKEGETVLRRVLSHEEDCIVRRRLQEALTQN